MKQRRYNGQFTQRHTFYNLYLLVGTILLGVVIQWLFTPPTAPLNPLVSMVEAREVEPRQSPPASPSTAPTATTEPSNPIESYIDEVFGEYGESAKRIARCESSLDPGRIGDKNLITYYENEIVGDSIGIFQIRTGGKGWSRARANGMTANEFREKLKDYRYNVDYAKTIFDQAGKFGDAWVLCSKRTGVK